jgi:acetylornithine deacetylase/succinyl-diaminopimelate desuccinylase-like protein
MNSAGPNAVGAAAESFIAQTWDRTIVPTLERYIAIPCKSPSFDSDWAKNGHLHAAARLLEGWARENGVAGMALEIVELPGRTPVIFAEIPHFGEAKADDAVLLYGHYDKQPEMVGWDEGKGPWIPVREGEKLYGRGGADDGYSLFASLTAIEALRREGVSHARCVLLIEGCEESGSFDLPHYVEHLRARIGTPSLVVCLDSGCGNYDQLWITTSLRGMVGGNLRVKVLEQGVHSGDASGIVPSSFRVLREVLDRVEDATTGKILLESLHAPIPEQRVAQAKTSGAVLNSSLFERFPWAGATKPMDADTTELVLNRTWRPFLAYTGIGGMPALESAGNVLRPETAVKLSLRLPPTVDAKAAAKVLKETLEANPPYGTTVTFEGEKGADGWNAPPVAPWLETALLDASNSFYGKESCYLGEGGSIPFMGMLGRAFPEAQFLITGVLGPQSNAHGPNEFLHIGYAKKLTACVAKVLAFHAAR